MAINWPTTLQQQANESGYSLVPGDVTLRSDMESGPPKVRALSTVAIDTHTVSIDIDKSKDQYNILMNFYRITLQQGTQTFTFEHPLTGELAVFRFLGPPKFTPMGGVFFKANMGWEEMYEAV